MKKNWLLISVGLLLITIIAAGCGGARQSPTGQVIQPVELTVSAAISLKDALGEIQKNYEEKNVNIKLMYNLGASGSLQKQIEQGAPADIYISAAPKQMDELEAKNFINKATRKNLVENKLVLIVPKNSKLGLNKFEDLTIDKVEKIGIGEPRTVPAGQYAQQVLQKIGLWDTIKDKAVLAKDVRTVLTYVETGNVEAGIVYKTDASSSKKVEIVAMAPAGSHQPIIYPVAILSETRNKKAAEDFLAYLLGPQSKAVFEKYGFVMGK